MNNNSTYVRFVYIYLLVNTCYYISQEKNTFSFNRVAV
jgi:hypothetical protein